MNYFAKDTQQVLDELNTCADGLTTQEAEKRLQEHGLNQLTETKQKNLFLVFLEQFKDLMVIILIISAIVSIITGNVESSIVIFAVITLNAILGTVQHVKAEKSLNSLKELSSPTAVVLRNGNKVKIPSKEVVVGDILFLEAGDLIVADGRILHSYSLQVNESSLTGESENVNKTEEVIQQEKVALGDQVNMVFSSSLVTYGRAIVVVTQTGMGTELGKIASLMNATKEKKTPLQVTLDSFGKKLSIMILIICAIVFGLSLLRGSPVMDSIMFAVALAVAAIPEALGSIVTIALAIGTQKMAKQNAIIKNLKAVEGLGCVSIICSDKTGTLTQNKMTVQKIFANGSILELDQVSVQDAVQNTLLRSSILCNDSHYSEGKAIGDPTEIALVDYYEKVFSNSTETRETWKRLQEIPFDSDRKLMSTLHKIEDEYIMYTKGAIDVLLQRVEFIFDHGQIRPISDTDRANIQEANLKLSQQGLRVLAFAKKTLDQDRPLTLEDENGYTFLGLISMIDPPREESAAAVRDCKRAGIKAIMITGDHKITASSIARQIGIFNDGDRSLDGVELDQMSDEELSEILPTVSVYARVSPEHKIRIVDLWQKKGQIVAMTGDGVNDAPALKKADIGIAMGITGTEVSKDAASMILTDDNFATIVKSIANGRNIYNNIKNSIKFLISGNMSGILSVLYSVAVGLTMPFTAVHLLFINLMTDSLPAIAISTEPPAKNLLDEKPRGQNESLMTKDFILDVLVQGFLIATATMGAFYIGQIQSPEMASTMAFATLCLGRLFHGFTCRGKQSILSLGVFRNRFTLLAFGVGILFLSCVLFIPPLQGLMDVVPMNGMQLGSIVGLAFAPTFVIQIYRIIRDAVQKNKQ